jgi:hypothetical protein
VAAIGGARENSERRFRSFSGFLCVDQNLGQAFEFSIEAWIDSPIIARIRFRPGT